MSSHLRAICLSLLLVLVPAGTVRAANLHFIMFAETLDTGIGTIQDLDAGTAWIQTIADATGLTLQTQTLTGTNLTPGNARNMLEALNPAEDDVVYFVYSGHGYNAGDSEWPTFAFLTFTGDPYVSLDEVVATLQPKAQRLLVVLADCCNVPEDDSGHTLPKLEPSADSALTTANIQRLFLTFRGTIVAAGAAKGQYGLGDDTTGGLFLSSYLNAFNALTASMSPATWEAILSKTKTDTHAAASEYADQLEGTEPQNPVYTINTEQVASDIPEDPADDTSDDTTDDATDDTTDDTTDNATGDATDETTDTGDTDDTQLIQWPPVTCGATGLMPFAALSFLWLARVRRP
jgi:hypothetical protein